MDDRINESFERRATRGEERGADAVFEAASDGARTRRSPAPLLAAAAALVVFVGLFLALRSSEETPVELDVVAPIEIPAICEQGFEIVGATADDPPGHCAGGGSANIAGFEPLQVAGSIDATVVESAAGGWMIDVVPRPDLIGPVALPPDGAGGAAMLLASDPVPVSADGFDLSFELAVGHSDYRGERNPGGWYEVMVTPAREPGELRTGPLYLSDWFAGSTTFACRFELGGNTICRLTDANDEIVWQSSFVDAAGSGDSVGGFERDDLRFSTCDASDATASCMDTIRLRFSSGTLAIDLGGERYFEQGGLPDLPEDLVGDMAQWTAVVTSRSEVEIMRFHGRALGD